MHRYATGGVRLLCIFLLFPLFLFTACGGAARSTRDLLTEFLALSGIQQKGKIYTSDAPAYSEERLSNELADLLYQEANGENALSLCTEYSICMFPSWEGGELAFFRCRNAADAARVCEMASERLARLRFLLQKEEGFIARHGNDVVLIYLPNAENAQDILNRLY